MAIDTSLGGWIEELQYAAKSLRPYLASWREDKMAFIGQGYREGEGRNMPENHALEWFALMRGQLLIGNPQARFTTPLDGDAAARAQAITMAVNAVSKRLNLRDVNEQLLGDFGFKWATCLVKNAPPPGFTDVRSTVKWPGVYRISPLKYRYDCAADRQGARAWQAHLVIGSRKALLEEAKNKKSGWNRAAIDALERQNVKQFRDENLSIPERDEIAYWEIWCVEDEVEYIQREDGTKISNPGPEKGYNGTIFTVAEDQPEGLGWIRDPYPAFVPPWGPYCTGGDYLVPDESAPMGPITASNQQAAFLNRCKRSTQNAIEAYKRIIVCTDKKLADAIQTGRMDHVFAMEVDDLRSKLFVGEVGGATQQHFAAEESAGQSLQKVMGVTDIMKGIVDPRNKATQDALAAQAAGNRTSGTVAKFYQLVSAYLLNIAYFIDIDDEVEIELGPQAAGMFVDAKGNPTTRLRGGRHPNQDSEEFSNLQLELKVGSMESSLEMDAQLKLAHMAQTAQEMATWGVPASLFMDVQLYLDEVSDYTGIPAIKRMFSVEKMQALAMAQVQAGMAQAGGGEGGGQGGFQPSGSKPTISYAGNPSPGGNLGPSMAARASGPPSSAAGAARKLSSKGRTLDAAAAGK